MSPRFPPRSGEAPPGMCHLRTGIAPSPRLLIVARALQGAGMTFERGPSDMMPADLAKRFGVVP